MALYLPAVALMFFGLSSTHLAQSTGQEKPVAEETKKKTVTWKIGDVNREAIVIPPTKSEPKQDKHPLVFVFHGHGGKASFSARKFAIQELWPEAVCVYPQGLPTPSPIIDPEGKRFGWQKSPGDQKDRDLDFFDAMLKTMTDDYKVDPKRVYVAGHSNGGYFTYLLCATRGDKIAAIAPVAAALTVKELKDMKPKPVIHVAGEKDPIVRFSIQENTIEHMCELNGCDAEGKPAGEFCKKYASKKDAPVVAFIHPGGHEIPDGAPKRIVEFFKEFTLK